MSEFEVAYLRGLDPDTQGIYLQEGTKIPQPSWHPRGHKDSIPLGTMHTEGENYGIVLDDKYVVVDIDKPDEVDSAVKEYLIGEPFQNTPKGKHWLYRATPEMSKLGNTKLVNSKGVIVGDIKTKGYIVGPGSVVGGRTYLRVSQDILPAPTKLKNFKAKKAEVESNADALPGVPPGEHDAFLVSVAGFLRGRYALSAEAIDRFMRKGPLAALQGVDPTRPYTEDDIKRIVRSASHYAPEKRDELGLLSEDLENGVDFDFPLLEWYIQDFIPKGGYFLTGYAAGGTGKSSFGHKLAAIVTQMGDNFMVLNHEDTPQYWKACAVLSGADRSKLFNPKEPLAFKTPRDISMLEKWIVQNDIKVVWLDSVKDHFEPMESDAATHTRAALSPLASLAATYGVMIFGVFHTNKGGTYSGSTEMLNVARHVLEFERKDDQPLTIRVKKSNLRTPEHQLILPSELRRITDPKDPSKSFLERLPDGSVVTRETWVITEIVKDSKGLKTLQKNQEDWETILPLFSKGMSIRTISDELDMSYSRVQRCIKLFKDPTHIDLDNL